MKDAYGVNNGSEEYLVNINELIKKFDGFQLVENKNFMDNFNEIQNRMERIPKEPIIKQRQVLLQQTIDDIIDNMENDLKNTTEEYPTKSAEN